MNTKLEATMETATKTITLTDIPHDAIVCIVVRRSGSTRANSYGNWLDIVDCRRKFGDTVLAWDAVYGAFVATGINSKIGTMLVFVNREVTV